MAIDKEPEAIARTLRKYSSVDARQLKAEVAVFEYLADLPLSSLIHAGLALPFCRPGRFDNLWRQVCQALVPGGVFVGHLFGLRHSWPGEEQMLFHSDKEVRRLTEGFEIILMRETESAMVIDSGSVNWHRIDVIVRKPHQVLEEEAV